MYARLTSSKQAIFGNMAAVRRILRTNLFKSSLLQRCLGLRSFSTHVDDYVSGITDHQKQVHYF